MIRNLYYRVDYVLKRFIMNNYTIDFIAKTHKPLSLCIL